MFEQEQNFEEQQFYGEVNAQSGMESGIERYQQDIDISGQQTGQQAGSQGQDIQSVQLEALGLQGEAEYGQRSTQEAGQQPIQVQGRVEVGETLGGQQEREGRQGFQASASGFQRGSERFVEETMDRWFQGSQEGVEDMRHFREEFRLEQESYEERRKRLGLKDYLCKE